MMKRFLIAVPLLAAGMAFAPQAAHAQWRGGWHGGPGGWHGGYGGWHGGYGGWHH
ncbi:sulfur globule protein precursor, partial [Endobacter medicaginis]|nr:sulfur globule protein precursor [Endobacter medicaginis]